MAHRTWEVFLSLCSFGILTGDCSSTALFGLRLVGGPSRCQGELEVKHQGQVWIPVAPLYCNLQFANRVCPYLDCGSAIYVREIRKSLTRKLAKIKHEETSLNDSFETFTHHSRTSVELKCSDSVRLLGPQLCSGSLRFHWNQSWMPICDKDFDLQDAEVVCRELGCGAPSLLRGALYGAGRAPWQMFHCEGDESALMDCPRSSSGDTCSSRTAVELTCSDPDSIRLVGGSGRCDGAVQVKLLDQWRHVHMTDWDLRTAPAVCARLDCGYLVTFEMTNVPQRPVWELIASCVRSTSSLRECASPYDPASPYSFSLNCSDSVRLRGPRFCTGSLELRWDQSWTSACQEDVDLKDAEVVCRELGCGAPSLLQGALYEEGHAPRKTFQCEGDESALMDCARSSSGDTCSSGTAVELTCSEPVRLVGGASRCAGAVEVSYKGEWRPVALVSGHWNLEATAALCQDLNCGSAITGQETRNLPPTDVWQVTTDCVNQFSLEVCIWGPILGVRRGINVVCSDLLTLPNISLLVSADRASQSLPQGLRVLLGSDFIVRCSAEAQYPGGFFQLLSPTLDLTQNQTLPAVNHSAHFLFTDAGPAHKGGYTCVYHLHVFSYNFSSQSETLHLYLGISDLELILRVGSILLLKLIYIPALYFYCKFRATRGHQRGAQRAAV